MDNKRRPLQDVRPKLGVPLPPLSQTPVILPLDQSAAGGGDSQPTEPPQEPHKKKHMILLVAAVVLIAAFVAVTAAVAWYLLSLRPVSPQNTSRTRIEIVSGSSPAMIGELLQEKKVIRSAFAFELYTRLHGTRDKLQAGTYSLSPSESTEKIASDLVSGKVDEFKVTFLPGATLTDTTATEASKKTDIQTALLRAGFSQQEITAAFAASYDDPTLFAGKPAGTSLEGYVYGDTYMIDGSTTVQQLLEKTFHEYDQVLTDNDLAAKFQQHGLTLYQGITLASIIQREVSSSDSSTASADQRQVAQIFYTRLAQGIPLGSDVTAYYGADKIGAPRSVEVDTPYNTRLHAGLPPGPIAQPSLGALKAVADPAPGDYVYFLSGDDGKMYYAHTNDEHEQNIKNHCQIKCQVS